MNLTELSLVEFAEKLASDAPAPGGGSAAALSGALGAALVSMVCRLTVGREKYAPFEALASETADRADGLRRSLLEGVQKDTAAFDGVIAALKMPKGTDEERAARDAEIQRAYKLAVLSPQETAESCLAVMRLAEGLLHKSNRNAASDLSVGAMQACAGLMGALENVAINLPSIQDEAYAAEKRAWMSRSEREAAELLSRIRAGVAEMIA